ncbi:hypothetical protein HGRIS_010759 [Hohenbuehelia grisea]|uniref:Transcription regulator Rua1 C-terminal domain-containing protein n=1 Tax=Hohenbuehelia grisea TaxID=104357 RepID=A0ABR3IXN5_9AGAR
MSNQLIATQLNVVSPNRGQSENSPSSIEYPMAEYCAPFSSTAHSKHPNANHGDSAQSTQSDDSDADLSNLLLQYPEESELTLRTLASDPSAPYQPFIFDLAQHASSTVPGQVIATLQTSETTWNPPAVAERSVHPDISFSQEAPSTPVSLKASNISQLSSPNISPPARHNGTPFGQFFELASSSPIWPASEPFLSPIIRASIPHLSSPTTFNESPLSFRRRDSVRPVTPMLSLTRPTTPSTPGVPLYKLRPSSASAESNSPASQALVIPTDPKSDPRTPNTSNSMSFTMSPLTPLTPLTPLDGPAILTAGKGLRSNILSRPPLSPVTTRIMRSARAPWLLSSSIQRTTGKRLRDCIADESADDDRPGRRAAMISPNKENSLPQSPSSMPRTPTTPPEWPQRTFPTEIHICVDFAALYRRFPVSSYYRTDPSNPNTMQVKLPHPGGAYNPPRDAFDLYTPRFVKGKGRDKVGLCPICIESVARGGEGKALWLSMKFSAFNYHMQYAHGISATTCQPFSPPLDFRTVSRSLCGKHERSVIKQGKCHKCSKWISVEGVKDVELKVSLSYQVQCLDL